MTRPRTAHVTDVRPTVPADGEFFAPCTWLAIDSAGRRFGSTSADDARAMAERYNGLRCSAGVAALQRAFADTVVEVAA